MRTAFFPLFVASALANSRSSHCPWGHCDDEEVMAPYMHLLQLNADKRSGVQPGIHDDDSMSQLKRVRPYYHTSDEIRAEAKLLSKGCGGAMTIETHSDSDASIDLISIRAPKSNPVNKVFILFGEHSRELISPESGLRFLQALCGKASIEGQDRVPSVLLENEFQLVLNGNPNSRLKVENGEYCLRTNPNGVDLNRNWDEMWKKGLGDSSTNGGPSPFSEPETRIFKKLVEKFEPTTFLTVHSGTRGMYMPWAYDMVHKADFNAPHMLEVLKDLDSEHCQCPFGAAGKEVGYPCPGTCLDWVYSKLKTPYVFAFEIYTSSDRDKELKQRWDEKMKAGGLKLLQSGSHLGHEHFVGLFDTFKSDFVQTRAGTESQDVAEIEDADECFSMFNPDSESTYNATVQNWASVYLQMSDKIATQIKKDKEAALISERSAVSAA